MKHNLLEKIIVELSMSKTRCIFILPKVFVDVREVVKKFSVVKELKELAEDDSVLFDEYEIIFEDLRAVVKNFIDGYKHERNHERNGEQSEQNYCIVDSSGN